jgi:hypothetical protein
MNQESPQILMVRPSHFAYNEQTAESNSFQNIPQDISDIQSKVLAEFDAAVATLRNAGIDVWVIEDTDGVIKPDAIFPNNWISTHEDGTIILYPMLTPNRRAERRMDVVEDLKANYEVNKIIDLSAFEKSNEFLEGTGSIVFDHKSRIAYACLSPRTNKSVLEKLCTEIGYKPITFHSVDKSGKEVYHTNVIMGIGDGFAIICLESIKDLEELKILKNTLIASGNKIIEISMDQVLSFGGNVLTLRNLSGEKYLALSSSAYQAFTQKQIEEIKEYATLLPISIPTIEKIGGGSVRCMLAQNFLKKSQAKKILLTSI